MIAFLVLMIIMTIFLQAVRLSGNMVIRATQIRESAQTLAQGYYTDQQAAAAVSETPAVFYQGAGECFRMEITLKCYTDPVHGGQYYFFD